MQHIARSPNQMGAIVYRERRTRGLTQAQLGALIGRRQATISKLEKGGPGTQLATLFDIMAALQLEITVEDRSKAPKSKITDIF